MRQHPGYSEEMEQYLPKDPTPLRVEMTMDEFNRRKHLEKLQEESTVTKSQMWANEVRNFPENFLHDLKNDHRTLVGKVMGKTASMLVPGGFAAKHAAGFIADKATVEGMKKIDELSKKKTTK